VKISAVPPVNPRLLQLTGADKALASKASSVSAVAGRAAGARTSAPIQQLKTANSLLQPNTGVGGITTPLTPRSVAANILNIKF